MRTYARSCCAVILAIIGGCGGGSDSGDSAAGLPSPALPITAPDPAPPNPPPPEVPPPAGTKPSISGEVLIAALSWPRYSNDIDGLVAGNLVGQTPVTSASVEQVVRRDPADSPAAEGSYYFASAAYMLRNPFIPPRFALHSSSVIGRWAMAGSAADTTFAIGKQVSGDNEQMSVAMSKPEDWMVFASQTYELDQTLAQWSAVQDAMTWNAAVQIQSDDVPGLFRMCWQMNYPQVVRLSCGLFERQSGRFSGVHVSDDFEGQGPLIWRSVR